MRHRMGIGACTGLGNPDKGFLSNTGNLSLVVKKMAENAVELYFKKWGGCDYHIGQSIIMLGVEPAYQHERLKIITISRNKERSYLQQGYAFGLYGSQTVFSYMFYSDFKKRGKFKKFVDRWHPKVFQLKKRGAK